MASLLEACGPACLRHDDTTSIFYDHYILWNSCAITHRRPSIYSQDPWPESEWFDLPAPSRALLAAAARVPPLLVEWDSIKHTDTYPDLQDLQFGALGAEQR